MRKKKPRDQRPFDPGILQEFAVPEIVPRIGAGSPVNRFTIVVPIEQILPTKKPKATPHDLRELEKLLVKDFRGLTALPASLVTAFVIRKTPPLSWK